MSVENVLWGAPRIQGELLKLGFTVAQSTVAKYMAKRDNPSGQSWSAFLRNHAPDIAAMDLFVVPTIGFVQLYVLVIVRLARRELVWINVTRHPTAEWIGQQITEAFPWNEAPRYLALLWHNLFAPRLFKDLFSAVRTPLRRWPKDEINDGVTYGGHGWLRRRPVDSFFSAPRVRGGGVAGRRRQS